MFNIRTLCTAAIIWLGACSLVSANEIHQRIQRQFDASKAFLSSELFYQSLSKINVSDRDFIKTGLVLEVNKNELGALFINRPECLQIRIPNPNQNGFWDLKLLRTEILSNDYKISTSDGRSMSTTQGVHYQGIFNDDPHSLVALSLFENEVMGMFSNQNGNFDLGLYGKDQNTFYIFYQSNDLAERLAFDCNTADQPDLPESPALVAGDCRAVKLYFECDFDLYTKRSSSVSNVNTFVTGIFNQLALLYSNESIQVQLSQIFVWTSTDPYISQTTASTVLSTFRTTRTSFNGHLAHLLSTRSSGLGGIAYLNVLCGSNYKYAFSNIYNSYSNVPTYSWTVGVIAHETGHNLGSNHTQWCGWTGGALDNCYTTEGGCAAGPAPINGGTIMSYCHLVGGVGINLSNGFGTQPGDKIRTIYNAASCISGGPAVTVSPASSTICNGSSVVLTASSGASSYSWSPTAGLNVSNQSSVTASPSATTTYTLSAVSSGCTTTVSVPVTVLTAFNSGVLTNANQTFSGSGNPSVITFATAPAGGTGTFAYQWYSRSGIQTAPSGTSSTGWTAISGATASSYDPGVQSTSVSYAVMVDAAGSPNCGVFTWASGVRQITVNAASTFAAGAISNADQTFCSTGGDPANITFSTAPSGSSSFSRQWYFKNGINTAPTGSSTSGWTLISGATAANYDPPAGLTASRSYACFVTPASGSGAWASGCRQITVLPPFNPGTVSSGDQTFCQSGNPSNITLSSNPVGSGAYTWRWYFTETSSTPCPTGSSITGWNTNTTSTNITGTTTTGAGISFDPISAGNLNSGRTFAVLITPIANGAIPACGTAQWAASCRKTYVNNCVGGMEDENSSDDHSEKNTAVFTSLAYPNPASDILNIKYELPAGIETAQLYIHSLMGTELHAIKLSNSNGIAEIALSSLPVGTYFYSIEYFGMKLGTGKFVKVE
jgi:hypothetical protein